MNLKSFLKLFNISNKNFAKQIGVSAVSLSRYIIGERMPEKKIINKIIESLNSGGMLWIGANLYDDFDYKPIFASKKYVKFVLSISSNFLSEEL